MNRNAVLRVVELPQPGYIYLVNAVGTNKFKIGKTQADVVTRLKTFQTGCSLRLRLVYRAYISNMNMSEIELYQKFSDRREIGEWFSLTADDMEECILLMQLIHEAEPVPVSLSEEAEPVSFTMLSQEPDSITIFDKLLYQDVQKSRETGKSPTWIIENILKMKGRKFAEGKAKLQGLLNQFEGANND